MSRSGYSFDLEDWDLIRYRGAVNSAIKGKRGQAFLRELLEALDQLPEKELIAEELKNDMGEVCALGCIGDRRGLAVETMDPEDHALMSREFGIAKALVREIQFMNDDYTCRSPENRFQEMRAWVESQIQ